MNSTCPAGKVDTKEGHKDHHRDTNTQVQHAQTLPQLDILTRLEYTSENTLPPKAHTELLSYPPHTRTHTCTNTEGEIINILLLF